MVQGDKSDWRVSTELYPLLADQIPTVCKAIVCFYMSSIIYRKYIVSEFQSKPVQQEYIRSC
jgi:hypothetical protein